VTAAQHGVLLHPRWTDAEEPRATVIRSTDGGYTWHPIADACPDYADEVAEALQWCADLRAKEAGAELARIVAEIEVRS